MIDTAVFVENVRREFAKVKPTWKPPYRAVLSVATRMKLTATINGKSAEYWRKNIDHIFDDVDDFDAELDVVLRRRGERPVKVKLWWSDPRKVTIVGPDTPAEDGDDDD